MPSWMKGWLLKMKFLFRGLAAAACASALMATPAYAGPTVTVRVEAKDRTLVQTTQVTVGDGTFEKTPGASCNQNSVAGALELASGGDWGGAVDDQYGQQIERIKGVELTFASGRYWAIYVDRTFGDGNNCTTPLAQGDSVVFTAACAGSSTECWNGSPLDLAAPRTAKPGEAFGVKVTSDYDPTFSTQNAPVAGATVAGGGASATTTVDGTASVTLSQRGAVLLTASAPDNPRESVEVCVTDGADGYCGTTSPSGQSGLGGASTTTTTGSPSAFVPDKTAPRAFVASLKRNQKIKRDKAPKLLKGRVDEAGGVLMVKLRLTRTANGRCFSYSAKRERWIRRPKCGADQGWWFRIGDAPDWEYQLANKLPAGRYVLDVNVIDKSYNRDDQRRPGENRVVFTVE
jgi:hypothetical protein